MTIQIAFAALCDHAVVDQHGKLSAIGIWRQVMVATLPGVHPRAHLVMLTSGTRDEVGEHRMSITLRGPGDELTLEHNGVLGMPTPPPGVELIESPGIMVLDLPLSSPGEHAIVVTIDGHEAARVPFTVGVMAPPVPGQVH